MPGTPVRTEPATGELLRAIEELPLVYPVRWPPPNALTTAALQQESNAGDLEIHPIMVNGEHRFGAEVRGVNWREPVPTEIVQRVS